MMDGITLSGDQMWHGTATSHPMRRLLANRRGVLAGAAALVGAGLARLARPEAVQAGTDGDVVLGGRSPASGTVGSTTLILASVSSLPGLEVDNTAQFGNAIHGFGANCGIAGGSGSLIAFPNVGVVGSSIGATFPADNSLKRGVYGSATDVGVHGKSTSGSGTFGESGSGAGVYGRSIANAGVFGDSPFVAVAGVTGAGRGVQGTSTSDAGVYGQSSSNSGVYGTSSSGAGVYGNSTSNAAVYGVSPSFGVYGLSVGGTAVYGQSFGAASWAAQFSGNVFINGSLTVTGNAPKSAAVKRKDGSLARMYCQESPEPWFEDFGTGQLTNGQSVIPLSADFDEVVDGTDYRVFLTEIGDCGGLYVGALAPHRFEVRSRAGNGVSGTFHYRVVARRKDLPNGRMETVQPPAEPSSASQPKPPRAIDPKDLPQPVATRQVDIGGRTERHLP